MTNEEKAMEIVSGFDAIGMLVEMAEWKDKQHAKECESLVGLAVKESRQVFIDKACEFLNERLYPTVKVLNEDLVDVIDRWELIDEFRNAMCAVIKDSLSTEETAVKESLTPAYDAEYLQSKIDAHTKYMQEHGITSEQQLATLEEMREQEKYIPSADYLNAAKKAFHKACGWLAVYPWYQGVYEEFVKELEENL